MTTIIGLFNAQFNFVEFGIEVKAFREELGWTQKKMGEHFGYSGAFVSGIETGNNGTSFTISSFLAVCNFMQVNPARYFDFEDKPYVRYEEHTSIIVSDSIKP